jgi:hypothetical protein
MREESSDVPLKNLPTPASMKISERQYNFWRHQGPV